MEITEYEYMRYNTYNRNWRPATTTYRILATPYKSIVDIEDFGQLMPQAKNQYDQKLAYW
jgi:hypothetical protein